MTRLRTELLSVLLLVGAVGFFYFSTIREGHPWGDDFAQYIQHAENISSGAPYDRAFYVWDARSHIGPRVYPPVFPLLLAPVCHWAGRDLAWMKREVIATFLLSLVALFFLFRRVLSLRDRLVLLLLVAVNPFLWDFKDNVLSDMPFLLFVSLSLLLMEEILGGEMPPRHPVLGGLLLGAAIYLAYGTRSIGLVLLPVALAFSWRRWKKLTAAAWLGAGTCAALMLLQAYWVPMLGSYFQTSHFHLRTFTDGLFTTTAALGKFWDNGHSLALAVLIFLIALALAVLGIRDEWRAHVRSWDLFAAVYWLAICAWPDRGGPRYLFPILPIYFFYLLKGTGWLEKRLGPRPANAAFAAFLIATGATYAMKYSTLPFHLMRSGIHQSEARAFFDFVQTQVGEQEAIEFTQPRALALFTHRRASIYYYRSSETDMWSYLRDANVRYLSTGPLDSPDWVRFVFQNRACWDELFSNTAYHLYRVRRDAAGVVCAPGRN